MQYIQNFDNNNNYHPELDNFLQINSRQYVRPLGD